MSVEFRSCLECSCSSVKAASICPMNTNTLAMTANNPFGGYCSILPVGWRSFTGACDKQDIILKWSTAMETNNSYFTVERSAEGINWQVAGTVKGAGSASLLHTYDFTNRLPAQPMAYYRLKQTDFKGNDTYSEVITVKGCEAGIVDNLMLYPNPSAGRLMLLFRGDRSRVTSIDIFNSLGEKVYESTGFQSKIDLSAHAPGIYIMELHLQSGTITRKFEIAR